MSSFSRGMVQAGCVAFRRLEQWLVGCRPVRRRRQHALEAVDLFLEAGIPLRAGKASNAGAWRSAISLDRSPPPRRRSTPARRRVDAGLENRSTASRVEGIEPSATQTQLLAQQAPRVLGIQFVLGRQGSAISQAAAPGRRPRNRRETPSAIQWIRPRRTFFSSIRYSHCSPDSPPRHTGCLSESDKEITLPPISMTCAPRTGRRYPKPEIATRWPSKPRPRS